MARVWLIAILAAVVVPLIAFLLFFWMSATLESQWRAVIEAQYGPITNEAAGRVALAKVCADPRFSSDLEACVHITALSLLRLTSLGSVALGVLLLGITGIAAAVTKGSRSRMARILPMALRVILLIAAALLLADGILAVGLLVEGMMIWLQRVFPWFIGVAAIGAIIAVIGALRAVVAVGRTPSLKVLGVPLSAEQEPALFAEVDDVADTLGVDPPQHIVAGPEPSFFVVDAPVEAIGARLSGTTMFLSLPLCHVLTRAEFRAVIGHELGHFRGRDTEYTRRIAPLYATAGISLGTLSATTRGFTGFGTVPAALMLRAVFTLLFANAAGASRVRELEADKAGVEAASAADIGTSLKKLQLTSPAWEAARNGFLRSVATGETPKGMGATFLEHARAVPLDAKTLEQGDIPHPFDSHPPIGERLAALGVAAATSDVDLAPPEPAIGLFADPDALDARVTQAVAGNVRPAITASGAAGAFGPSRRLRIAATADPGIASLLSVLSDGRDPELPRKLAPEEEWVALADLLAAPEEDWDLNWLIDATALPTEDQWGLVDVAGPNDDPASVVPKGMRFRLVGTLDAVPEAEESEAHAYVANEGQWANRLLIVTGVGQGLVRAQAAGLLVVPSSDPLAATEPAVAGDVRRAAAMLLRTRHAETT